MIKLESEPILMDEYSGSPSPSAFEQKVLFRCELPKNRVERALDLEKSSHDCRF